MDLLAVDEPSVRFFSPKNAVGVKFLGGLTGLKELRQLAFGAEVALAGFVILAGPWHDLVGAETFEEHQDIRRHLLVGGPETENRSMTLVGRHLD